MAIALILGRGHNAAPVSTSGGFAPVGGVSAAAGPSAFPSLTCPSPSQAGQPWPPAGMLTSLPVPPGAVMGRVVRGDGALSVAFTVPTSYLDAGHQVRAALQQAGIVMVGGDQEPREIDTRFLSSALTGGIKFVQTGSCTAQGYVNVVDPTATASPAAPLPASLLPTTGG